MADGILQNQGAVASSSYPEDAAADDDALAPARGLVYGLLASAALWAVVIAGCLILAGCGGGATGSTSAAVASNAPGTGASDPPSTPTPPASSPPLPVCPAGATTPLTQCSQCPTADVSGSFCVIPSPSLPVCPVGSTELYISVCQCPTGDANGSTCSVPAPTPPPTCPTGTEGTPPDCTPIPAPTMSLSADPTTVQSGGSSVLTWGSTGASGCYGAAGWPSSDELAPSGYINTGPLTATASYSLTCSGDGGTATASVTITVQAADCTSNCGNPPPPTCTPPDVLIGQTCEVPPTIGVSLGINPTTVVDSSRGCPDPAGNPCVAVLTITPTSSLQGDSILCYVNGSEQPVNWALGWSTSPYPAAQDGPQVISVACHDPYDGAAAASITLMVIPPSGPPADTFTGSLAGNVETVTWATYGTDGCYVEQFNTNGVEATLQPGGGTSGTATSGFLSPSYEPFQFVLYCGGVPDTNVPTITVSP